MKRLIIFLLVCMLFGCATKHKSQNNIISCKIDAQYTHYVTAMGKGKGIIFKINISNIKTNNFQIDSFFVNGTPMVFTINNKSKTHLELESNYLKSVQEPGFSTNSNENLVLEITDDIIENQQFYPSWILVSNHNQTIKINIENYKLIK